MEMEKRMEELNNQIHHIVTIKLVIIHILHS